MTARSMSVSMATLAVSITARIPVGFRSYRTLPIWSVMRVTATGVKDLPPLANAPYAVTNSSKEAVFAPKAIAGRSSISPLKPNLRAMRTTLPRPVFIRASTVATLMDRFKAPRMVYSPP